MISEGFRFSTNRNGDSVVTKYVSHKEVYVKFIDTGFERKTSSVEIKRGTVKDLMKRSIFGVGFIGGVRHKAKINGSLTDPYVCYSSMMARCYSPRYQKGKPSYTGCTVCEEWHNFQNFADWYYENYPDDGGRYELDKDSLVDGNKIYSPSTCTFISGAENSIKAHAKSYRFKNPDGVYVDIYNLTDFCRKNNLQQASMSAVSLGKRKQHKGWTI
ncbi:hypothetical protein Athena1_0027 [Vibrio phage Athena1]|nr:hypothetical protein Athena1_0027 [Vibrio phage Athena1]